MINRRHMMMASMAAGLSLPAQAVSEERIASGDVRLFARRFGKPGKTPILIMHGANYFDSFDWIGVAEALSTDREVVAYDMRGFGESGWSPSKNYSVDALMGDAIAVMDHCGWKQAIVLGHSFSGRLAVSIAALFPGRVSRLIVVDSAFGKDEPTPKGTGNPPVVFAIVEEAMARFAKLANPPRISKDPGRALQALVQTPQGLQLKRDPDYANAVPLGFSGATPPQRERDVWADLSRVQAPMLFVRGLKSNRFVPEILGRLQKEFPQIVWATAESMHDIPYYSPGELITAVKAYVSAV